MELLYIWIEQANIIRKQGFNLTSKYFISYNCDEKIIKIDLRENNIEGFFKGLNQNKECSSLEIIGIVGSNGTGKSTLLDTVIGACTVMPSDLIIFEENNQIKIATGGSDFQNITVLHKLDNNPIFLDDFPSNEGIIYYSNVFDYNSSLDYNLEVMSPQIHNISTNFLLNFSRYIDSNHWPLTQRDSFRSDEIIKQIIFLYNYKERKNDFFPFSIPTEIEMELPSLRQKKDSNKVIENFYNQRKTSEFNNIHDVNVFRDTLYLNILVELMDQASYQQEILLEIVKKYYESDEKISTTNIIRKIINESLEIYLINDKNSWIVRDINSKLHFLDIFDLFIEQGSITSVRNDSSTIIFKFDEHAYNMVLECNKCIHMPVVLFDWYEMSSGEKTILSMYSRFYDLTRTNNILPNEILILIDEIDTYLHPEWQRNIISSLVIMSNEFFYGKNVKILISSHSPFIVSDLPKNNILFLYKDYNRVRVKTSDEVGIETFCANIHTLYMKAFFINNTIGEFSNQKIKGVIKDLMEKQAQEILSVKGRKEEIEFIINNIGETIIKSKIEELYNKVFPKKIEDYKLKISKLEAEKIELEKIIKTDDIGKIKNIIKLLEKSIRNLNELGIDYDKN